MTCPCPPQPPRTGPTTLPTVPLRTPPQAGHGQGRGGPEAPLLFFPARPARPEPLLPQPSQDEMSLGAALWLLARQEAPTLGVLALLGVAWLAHQSLGLASGLSGAATLWATLSWRRTPSTMRGGVAMASLALALYFGTHLIFTS